MSRTPCLPLLLLASLVLGAALEHRAFAENANPNPCENFYAYVCESQYKNPDGSISNFKSLVAEAQDNVVAKLKAILEEDDVQSVQPVKTARTFYASCMDTETIDAQGIKPIQSVLKEVGGWPLTRKNSDDENLVNWQSLHAFYAKINVFPLYEISVNNDVLRRIHTISLRQPKPIVREPFLHKQTIFSKYVEYIKTLGMKVANASGSSASEEEITEGAKQVASFEAEISKILEEGERLNFYRPIVLKKFQNITDQVASDRNQSLNWVEIINDLYSTTTKLVTDEDVVDVSTFNYFAKLFQLLFNTPARVVANYIHWRFVHQFLPHTSKELSNLYFDMREYMHEPIKNLSRWRFCGFDPALDNVLSYTFAKKHISAKTEKVAYRVLNDIKQVAMRALKRSSMLNQDEKRQAEYKILSMNFVLGVPESLKNLSVLNSYYKKLTTNTNYFSNILNLRRFYKNKELETVGKKDFQSTENNNFMKITTLSSIGSAYEFFENSVLIKIENLMPPLFEPDFPEFKKYGMLGFIIAYEIMHAFNDADSIGSSKPRRHLYSEETKLRFWEKMECFINQFDNYYIPDPFDSDKHVYVDGERSAMENMADSAAIQIAFHAFRERLRKQGFSVIEDDENFFASYASLLCRPELEEFYLSRFNLALRTLPRFRVIGSLSNTNEFAKAFSCSSGARMNPEAKCNFWN